MLPVKLLNNPIKRFTARQNYIFLASSLSLLWSWMFVTALIGLYLIHITGLNWTGPIVPIAATGLLIFFSLRCLISFPNNARAFWTVLLLPVFLIIVLNLPTFDSSFNQEYGIGFSISIYLSSLFIAIAVLCRDVEA